MKFNISNVIAVGFFCSLMTTPSDAQVVPDATLQNNTTININGTTINIEGGTRLGNNLFHSLREFSVPTGSTGHFNNPIGIESIITRITGGTVSNIDQLIRLYYTSFDRCIFSLINTFTLLAFKKILFLVL